MKKLHRFLISHIDQSKNWVIADKNIVHQVNNVLKMKIGEKFIVFINNGNDIVISIKNIDKNNILVETVSINKVKNPSLKLTAIISIVKGNTFEMIVQKLTEIGVESIIPLLSDRTVKQSVKITRLQSISNEALEQSGGTRKVTIYEPMKLEDCLKKFNYPSIVFEIGAKNITNNDLIQKKEMVMYIGPEGGWSDNDLNLFKKNKVKFVGLGTKTLRTDTASIIGAYTLLQ